MHCIWSAQAVQPVSRSSGQFTAAPDKMKKVELHGYLVFLDDAYRADPPGPDGKPTGRFRLAGRDRELRVFTEQVR